MHKGIAELVAKPVYRKRPVARHKQQEKSHADHERIEPAVKIPLHRREIYKHDPEYVVSSYGKPDSDNPLPRKQPLFPIRHKNKGMLGNSTSIYGIGSKIK